MNLKSAVTWCFIASLLVHSYLTTVLAQVPARPKKLAPGVLTVVPPAPEEEETYTGPFQLKDLNAVDFSPNYAPKTETVFERAKKVVLRRPIWNLEFSFKPLRMIEADIPQPSGKMEKKLIWYMVYRVRNIGSALIPKAEGAVERPTFVTESSNALAPSPQSAPNWFTPIFVLEGWVQDPVNGQYAKIPYTDRVIPAAEEKIREKEGPPINPALKLLQSTDDKTPKNKLMNSAEVAQIIGLPLSDEANDNSAWGVVTWEDLDPRIDFLSIYVQGLTNAFRLRHGADGTPSYNYKTLQLNFWRPGDARDEHDDRIRRGVPLVTNPIEQARIFNFLSVPGPSIVAYEFDSQTDKQTFLFRADGQINAQLESELQKQLNSGSFPDVLRQSFAQSGIAITGGVTLTKILEKSQWEFTANVDGVTRNFRLRYDPQYWQKTEEGIQINERVDYFWVYR